MRAGRSEDEAPVSSQILSAHRPAMAMKAGQEADLRFENEAEYKRGNGQAIPGQEEFEYIRGNRRSYCLQEEFHSSSSDVSTVVANVWPADFSGDVANSSWKYSPFTQRFNISE